MELLLALQITKTIGVHFDLKSQGLLGPANDVYLFFYLQTFVITELTTRDFNSPREKWKSLFNYILFCYFV